MSRQTTTRRPVRSAPLRRRGRRSVDEPVADGIAEPAEAATDLVDGAADPVAATEPVADAGERPDGTVEPAEAADPAEPADATAEPADAAGRPVSYRERRARRQASTQRRPVERRARVSRGRNFWWMVAGAVCGVFIVACLIASTLFAVGTNRLEHQNDLRASYSTFARQMTIDLTSLNPGNVDKALQTVQDKTSGDAQQRIRQSMAQVTDLIRTQNQTVTSSVITDAVTKATDDEGSVIVVYGWEMKSQDPKQETVVQTFRWRVDITRINNALKMTNFEWVI
ncbi:hypothetical protein [Gordonia aichiensis]|uniref:hypothetical protein n=1 Tax=Gordonia aichiensis TaxID=36820 RepID=UPI00034567ED|nr:hypothetical protein [Gordonia aichiensis]